MLHKLKHRLPTYSTIDHLALTTEELEALTKVTLDMESEFKSVLEANKKLCGVNHDLTKAVYDNFFQISLTDSEYNQSGINLEECEATYEQLSASIRRKKLLASTTGNALNENEYGMKTEHYSRYKELFDGVLAKFKGKTTRVRLVKLQAGTSIAPHIDYDPSYAVRIIIPIIASPEVVNVFWVKNNVESTTFVPGKAYFLNTGYKHAVMNFSKEDRYTFMVSVNGVDDIAHLITD